MENRMCVVTSLEEGKARFFVSTADGGAEFKARANEFGFKPRLVKEGDKVLGTEVVGSFGDIKDVLVEHRTSLTLVIK